MKKILEFSKNLPKYVDHRWFPFLLGMVAFADYFIFIIPLEAIVVASIIAARKRWFSISFWTTVGSTIGATLFAYLIKIFGDAFLIKIAPHLLEGEMAFTISHWLQNYGFWALIGLAAIPINQHPTVAVAALAKVSLPTIFITQFIGRFLKYGVYTWLTTHAKTGLKKFFKE